MKHAKKIVVLLLVAIMAIQMFGCTKTAKDGSAGDAAKTQADSTAQTDKKPELLNKTGFPIVNEKITLKGFGRRDPQHGDWDKMMLWEEMEKLTGIHIEWETPGKENVKERVNLILATNELPDFFIKGGVIPEADLIKNGVAGTFIPLEKLMEEYTPNVNAMFKQLPDVKQAITAPDGHIYSLPTVYTYAPRKIGRYPLINTKWLDNVGMKAPTNSDELIEVLKAFKEKDANGNGDPNDEIPYSAHDINFAFSGIKGMFGLGNQLNYYANIENNKVKLWMTDENYKQCLMYMNNMYKQGLLDKEIFTQTDKLYFGKLADGKIGFTPLYQPRNAAKYANEYQAIVPPKGPTGIQNWMFLNPSVDQAASFIITKANKYPEATIRLADYFYTDEGATLVYLGKEGETFEKGSDGKYHYVKEILESDKGMEGTMGQKTIFPGGSEPGFYHEKQLAPTMEGTPMPTYYDIVKPYLLDTVYRMPLLTADRQQELNQLRTDINTYFEEMRAKFIMGDVPFTDWDKYVAQINKMGLDKLEKILQDAFEGK